MNRHETAHAIVFDALTPALAQAFGYVPTSERHQLAELVCVEVEQDALHCAQLQRAAAGIDGESS